LPLNETVPPEMKPVPVTVRVKVAPPARVFAGEIDVIVGIGLFTVKEAGVDVPPPGGGFVTVTLNVPAAAMSPAVIAAVSCVALINVVALAAPLKFTTDVETKLVPVTVREKAGPPFVPLAGEIVVIVGRGLPTPKVTGAEVPPPGAGFVTVTLNVPAVAISGAVIDAVTCVALTNVVVAAVPLKFTTEVETNPVPFTVSVKPGPPTSALTGESVVIAGSGFVTVKTVAVDVPPPGAGFVTITLKVPAVAIDGAVIAAVTFVELTKVVATAVPLKFTTDEETKPVPFTVSVKAVDPASALVGEIVVIAGAGFVTVKIAAVDVPPPGVGLVTVTLSVPAVAICGAAIAAVIWVALTNVVVAAVPLKLTVAPFTNPVPFTVNVNAAPPSTVLDGDSVVIVGSGFVTEKLTGEEAPPPGAGFVTITGNDPAAARSPVVTWMVT
jgi:hypothetical protein